MTRNTVIKASGPFRAHTMAALLFAASCGVPASSEGSASAAASPLPVHLQGEQNCRFLAPSVWRGHVVHWEGACANGTASGMGVLRAYAKHKPTQFFYGRLVEGVPRLGVIEQPDGFVAGEFHQGDAVPNDDPGRVMRAFREAALAAKQASVRFKAKGNEASARFYLEKAQQLEAQID